jgi:hypothetical protein
MLACVFALQVVDDAMVVSGFVKVAGEGSPGGLGSEGAHHHHHRRHHRRKHHKHRKKWVLPVLGPIVHQYRIRGVISELKVPSCGVW